MVATGAVCCGIDVGSCLLHNTGSHGVGPMNVIMLLANTITAAQRICGEPTDSAIVPAWRGACHRLTVAIAAARSRSRTGTAAR
jgi:hypothetical protein